VRQQVKEKYIRERILLLTPNVREAALARKAFQNREFQVEECKDVEELCLKIKAGAGAAVVAKELLTVQAEGRLVQALQYQPLCITLIVLVSDQEDEQECWRILHYLEHLGATLHRPVQVETLLRAVDLAVKSRQRQLEIRENLAEHERLAIEMRTKEKRLEIALKAGKLETWEWYIEDGNIKEVLILNQFRDLKSTRTFKEFESSIHPAFREEVLKKIKASIEKKSLFHAEYKINHSEKNVWFESWGKPLTSNGEVHSMLGVVADISHRKDVEKELTDYQEHLEELVEERTKELKDSYNRLRISERMASIGTLSAGLGHDMGNLLLPVRVRLEALSRKALPEDLKEDISVIEKSTQYLQRLASGLRLFALDPEKSANLDDSTNVQSWWSEVEPFLKNVLPKQTNIHVKIEKDMPAVRLAKHRLTQAIFNLVQNAGDALKKKPTDSKIEIQAVREDDHVVITVSDNGPGMNREAKERCLEPFYTTKPRGISTGLGLSLVSSIVKSIDGRIEIDSTPNEATTIKLFLPFSRKPLEDDKRDLAVLSLKDKRLNSYAASLLRPLFFDVEISDRPDNPRTSLWITESAPGILKKAEEFLHDGEDRQVAIFKSQTDESNEKRITRVVDSPKPKHLREFLQSFVAERANNERRVYAEKR